MSDKKFNDDSVLERVIEKKNKVEKPRMWKVIFLNDDFTTVTFVVEQLKKHFKHSEESANDLAQTIHKLGSGIAGVYSHEISETKAYAVMQEAKVQEFPLRVVLMPEKGSD